MAQNRGPQLAAVVALFMVLAWTAVSLRCYVRAIMIKNFGADDWLAVAALVSQKRSIRLELGVCALRSFPCHGITILVPL